MPQYYWAVVSSSTVCNGYLEPIGTVDWKTTKEFYRVLNQGNFQQRTFNLCQRKTTPDIPSPVKHSSFQEENFDYSIRFCNKQTNKHTTEANKPNSLALVADGLYSSAKDRPRINLRNDAFLPRNKHNVTAAILFPGKAWKWTKAEVKI